MLTTRSIFTLRSLIIIFSLGFLYVAIAALLINFRLVTETMSGSFPVQYKLSLLLQLILGIFTAFGWLDGIFLILNGLFIGLNIVLITHTIKTLEGMGKVKLSVGGATLIGLVTTGCGACGLTLLSLLGVSTSVTTLPFQGLGMHILSLAVLIFSSWYMIRKLLAAQVCKLY